ncbi:MAG: tetratricopeptide repeat protein [Acidobacteriota bacterium]
MRIIALSLSISIFLGISPAQADFDSAREAYAKGDYATAFNEMKTLAENGHVGAQSTLGSMYLSGKGVAKDSTQALLWYARAAEQGDAKAQSLLGSMYFFGTGVSHDDVQAYMWLSLAAEQGDKMAVELRDKLAARMSADKVKEAKQVARKWKQKK